MSSRPTRGTARLAAILDALPDALLLVNSNGTIVDANAAAVRSLQTPGTALVGMGLLDLLPEFDPSRIPGSMRPRGRTRTEDGAEVEDDDGDAPVRMTARRTDGTVFPVEVSGNEFEDDGLLGGGLTGGIGSNLGSGLGSPAREGSREGYGPYDSYGGVSRYGYGASGAGAAAGRPSDRQLLLIVVRDLSARLEVEAELRRQHKQTEMILRAAAEGVLGVDIEGRVVLVNPAAAHILGYRASELGGQELLPLVQHSRADGTPQPTEESPLADTLTSGRKHRVRATTLWRKDGRPVHVELSTAPVRDGDQLVGAVLTFTDRTAHLALTARHEHLTAVLQEELDEPLTRLRTTLEKLADDPAGQLWPEANWVLRRLAAECARTSRLVDGVLSYQRFDAALDAGRETLDRRPVDLDQIVRRAVAAATELIGEDRVRFAVHPSDVEVIADQERLAQALGHLIADVAADGGEDEAKGKTKGANGGSGHGSGRGPSGHGARHGASRGPGGAAGGPGQSHGGNGLYGMAVGVASELTGTQAQGPTVVIAAAQRGSVARIEVRGPSAGGSPVHLPIARGMVERHGGVLQSHELPGKQGRTYVVELPLDPATAKEAAERAAAAARATDRPKENDTAMLPELPGLDAPLSGKPGPGGSTPGAGHATAVAPAGHTSGGSGSVTGTGAGTGAAALPAARRSDESMGGAAAPGAALALSGGADSGRDGGGQAQATGGAETPAQGIDRSRRRRALPAPEVVRPPRAVVEAQQVQSLQAEAERRDREQAQERQREQQQAEEAAAQGGQGTRTGRAAGRAGGQSGAQAGGFPGLIGAPVYPGLEHALPPAGSRIDTPAAVAELSASGGRRRRLAMPQGADEQGGRSDASGGGSAPARGQQGNGPLALEAAGSGGSAQGSPSTQASALPASASVPAQLNGHGQGQPGHPAQQGHSSQSLPLQQRTRRAVQQGQQGQQQGHGPGSGSGSGSNELQPVPAAPFGGRFGPDGGGNRGGANQDGGHRDGVTRNGSGSNDGRDGNGGPDNRSLAAHDAAAAPAADRQGSRGRRAGREALALEAAPVAAAADSGGDEAVGTESRLEFIAGADYPTMIAPAADGRPRQLLVWPEPDPSTGQALQDRGYRPVIVSTREELEAQVAGFPAALFVDPLTGPITRTALQSLRTAAGEANVPVLVTAGLGQATREAAYGADPAVLLRALAPRDSERHAPRVLLVEQDPDIAAAFTATLERRGMHVVHAVSENDAVEKAGSVQPNLVVMDLMLIRRRRVGIVDWLRDNNQLHRTPLVVYTSVDGPVESAGLRSGETVLFLAERSTSGEVQARIVDLLGKIGSLGQ